VRRDVAWKRLRKIELNHDHHSFSEHDALVDLIEERDTDAAADCCGWLSPHFLAG